MKDFEPQLFNADENKSKIEKSSKRKSVFLEVGDLSTYNSLKGGDKENERTGND